MSVPPNRNLADYFSDLCDRNKPVTWEDWLPVAAHAGREPEQFLATFTSVDADTQLRLLDLLKADGGEPFSDVVVAALARRSDSVPDQQVRDYILDDAQEAAERRLTLIYGQRAALTELVGGVSARQEAGFDAAAAIVALEKELLRLQQAEGDDQFARLHALERQVLRLDAQQRSLHGFDFEACQHHYEALVAEIGELTARKRALQDEVSEATSQKDRAEQDVNGLREQLAESALRAEHARSELERAEAELGSRRDQVAQANEGKARIQAESIRLLEEKESLDRQLGEDRRRLAELRQAAAGDSAANIVRKIDEVFSLLPPDEAEKDFTATGRTRI